jgi:hypothetical protein
VPAVFCACFYGLENWIKTHLFYFEQGVSCSLTHFLPSKLCTTYSYIHS